MNRLVAPLPVIWPTAADGERALDAFREYHLSDGLGLWDALIAASLAIGLDAMRVTDSAKRYRMIDALRTEQPYAR